MNRSGQRHGTRGQLEAVLVPTEDGQTSRQTGEQGVMLCRASQEDIVNTDLWAPARDASTERAGEQLSAETDTEEWLAGEDSVAHPVTRPEQTRSWTPRLLPRARVPSKPR
jgi:hypothetical protein